MSGAPTLRDVLKMLAKLDAKIDRVDGKVNRVDGKVDRVDGKADAIRSEVVTVRGELATVRSEMRAGFDALTATSNEVRRRPVARLAPAAADAGAKLRDEVVKLASYPDPAQEA